MWMDGYLCPRCESRKTLVYGGVDKDSRGRLFNVSVLVCTDCEYDYELSEYIS